MEYTLKSPAANSCMRCKFEKTCGYSFRAKFGPGRYIEDADPCPLGEKSYGKGPFFQIKRAA